MKPVAFKQANIVIGANQKQYIPLPAYRKKDSPIGEVVSCWQLSFKEWFKVLWTGRIYVTLWTFNNPLQPQRVHVDFDIEDNATAEQGK